MAKKSGLGRGLESLLGETAGEVMGTTEGVHEVGLNDIQINPQQPRKEFGAKELEELTDSVRRNGVLQPILLRPHEGGYQVVAGERRYQAAKAAGLETIPAVVRDIDDTMVLQLALIENLQRSDLNPMEEAFGFQTLMRENGLTQAQIAEAVSKSRSAIANSLRLTALPQEVQDMVADGRLSAGHARAILSVDGEEQRIALARRVVANQLTVRQTENLASRISVSGSEEQMVRAQDSDETLYQKAATRLSEALNAKVRVRRTRNRRKIEIDCSDDEQLRQMVVRLSGVETLDGQDHGEGE